MTQNTHHRRIALVAVVSLVLGLLWAGGFGTATVAAQTNNTTNISEVAPYYENHTDTPNLESWTAGATEPSVATLAHWLSRIPTFVLGDGGTAQGGGPMAGLLFSVILIGGVAAVGSSASVGSVGGAVLGTVGILGLVAAGFVPVWLKVILLFVLGAVASIVIIDIWR